MNMIINIAWKGTLAAAAFCAAPAYAGDVDFSKIPDVRIFEGDCYKNCSIGIAWSDDLKEWTWPGKTCKLGAGPFLQRQDAPVQGRRRGECKVESVK